MNFVKRTLPLFVAFFSGLAVMLAFFSGPSLPYLKSLEDEGWKWIQIVISFSMLLGAVSLLQVNLGKIRQRIPGWGYNAVLISAFLITSLLGLLSGMEEAFSPGEKVYILGTGSLSAESSTVLSKETDPKGNDLYLVKTDTGKEEKVLAKRLKGTWKYSFYATHQFLFLGVFKAGQATMVSLLAFFVASASFRAFRVRSWEALILVGTAFLVMLGNIPLAPWLDTFFLKLGIPFSICGAKEWILSYPSSGAQSAILIGAALGYVSSSLKVILGIERSYLGDGK